MSRGAGGHCRAARAAIPILAAFLLATAEQTHAGELELSFPVDCKLGVTCFIQNYVDIDTGPGTRDYRCGQATYDGHKGTDFRLLSVREVKTGVNVLAAAPGIVKAVRDGMPDRLIGKDEPGPAGRECGNGVVLDHGAGWETQYCHLRRGSLRVRKGDRVKRGAVLGDIGYSGRTQFAHLHLSVRRNGKVVDPFTGKGPGAACLTTPRTTGGLWARARAMPYEQGQLVETGFADGALSTRALEDGSASAKALTAQSAAAVFFARFLNLQKGDQIKLRLTGPHGLIAGNTSAPLARAKAQVVSFAGGRLRTERWPAGSYSGTVWLLRKGEIISQHQASMTLTD